MVHGRREDKFLHLVKDDLRCIHEERRTSDRSPQSFLMKTNQKVMLELLESAPTNN